MALTLLLSSAFQGSDVRETPYGSFPMKRQTTLGFKLAKNGMLEGLGLATACEQVLYQEISCDAFVSTLGGKGHRASLGDVGLTDVICSTACTTALTTARRRIAGSCASTPDLFLGYPLLTLVDSIISGRDETCLKDSTTGEYCNDIIESFDPVNELADLPEEQLYSYCYGAKLSIIQGSLYSAYDEYHAQTLEYINQNCDAFHPTEPLDPLPFRDPDPEEQEESACSGPTYTAQAGDTCDSIALAESISAATLYYINPALLDCANITAGQELCLPPTCDVTYTVLEEEETIVAWNAGLDSRCSDIWSTNPFWGRVICASAPGGVPEGGNDGGTGGTPGNGGNGGQGGKGDGYADRAVDPPAGAIVADGTTLKCGKFIQAKAGLGCSNMVASASVPMDLFLAANLSLETAASCTSDLVIGNWYCLNPTPDFDQEEWELPPRPET